MSQLWVRFGKHPNDSGFLLDNGLSEFGVGAQFIERKVKDLEVLVLEQRFKQDCASSIPDLIIMKIEFLEGKALVIRGALTLRSSWERFSMQWSETRFLERLSTLMVLLSSSVFRMRLAPVSLIWLSSKTSTLK